MLKPLARLLRALVCLYIGHRYTPWRLLVVHYSGGIAKDATARACQCCGRTETQVIPFRRFTITRNAPLALE